MLQEATLTQLEPRFLLSCAPRNSHGRHSWTSPAGNWGYFCFGASSQPAWRRGAVLKDDLFCCKPQPSCRAWAISSAQHTTLERQRLPAEGGHQLLLKQTLVNNFKGLFKLQLATALICLLLCCTFFL